MINETFKLIEKDFTEADLNPGIVAATYESKNFKVTLGYDGAYNKAKNSNTFEKTHIGFTLKPKDKSKYPSIAYDSLANPYDDTGLMPMDDSPITKKAINAHNYKQIFAIYDEIFPFARKTFDEILPEYFPKDAKYI